MSGDRLSKSRVGVTSVTDNINYQIKSDYLTLYFNGDQYNTLAWEKTFNGTGNGNDIATDISTDGSGNLYVTGYSNRSAANPYDFATIKYNYSNGSYGWNDTVKYFNYGTATGEDKASSIKTKGNKIYVSGTSQNAPNGIYTMIYEQNNGVITNTLERVFYPSFNKSDAYSTMSKASKIEIDSAGNLIVIAFAWNTTVSKFAVIKYDSLGNVIYILDEDEIESDNLSDTRISNQVKPVKYNLKQNFPNPFNPITKISYSLSKEGNVRISVYNTTGQLLKEVVNEYLISGEHSVEFDGSEFSSGVYFYRIESNDYTETKRMILTK
ncbi:MAG: T9SS type A sorting domain-containing protein [Ignavibacteria bacterium]|nr:T9SS type A sorting domain-containing protein [Ignavibacteria bacterium]